MKIAAMGMVARLSTSKNQEFFMVELEAISLLSFRST